MSSKNYDKTNSVLKELEKTISPVLVVNNSSLKPFVELFEYAPENIYQQPLGSLVGFFEVKEYSDESAYIVNFLTSVLKKEYYINPKRPVTESLDSALHKVNLALSELAKQGNVEWLGKIHAAICVIEKNNAHFSVSGDAKIFLHRKQLLSEISEDLASDEPEPHPLKTFINVSSGRLEKNDRLLITSGDIFQILSINEIKKNFERLEGEKFVQFLKTALSNQIEMTASVVIDMNEPAPEIAVKPLARKKLSKTENVFSEKTFANSLKTDTTTIELAQQLDELQQQEEEAKETNEDSGYTDKKTGHIYIQGEAASNDKSPNPQISFYQDLLKEKISQGVYLTKNEIRRRYLSYKKQLAKKRAARLAEKERLAQIAAEEAKILEEKRVLAEIENEQRLAEERELERIELENAKIAEQELQLKTEQENQLQEKNRIAETKQLNDIKVENHELSFKEKLRLAQLEQQRSSVIDLRKKVQEPEAIEEPEEDFIFEDEFENEIEQDFDTEVSKLKKLQFFIQDSYQKSLPFLQQAKETILKNSNKLWKKMRAPKTEGVRKQTIASNLAPHFSKIKELFSKFTKKQKLYTLAALAIVFIVPFFIVHFLNKPKTPTITELTAEKPNPAFALANEKNISLNTEVRNVYSNPNIITSFFANDSAILITKTSIVLVQNGQSKEFPLPEETSAPTKATYMNDLSLVFVMTSDNKIISFSPISGKFTQNNIDLANISPASFIGTYLTYLYVLDQNSNQIYRFPRADGGFGAKTDWLKETASLSGVSDMTIDDNIYAAGNNQVLKFFKGKTIEFSLEKSNTPISYNKIYTTPDLQFLYVMDTQNSRIVEFNKDGSIAAQFYNEQIKNGTSFSVDEKNKLAFIATPSGLISVLLQ